MAIINSNLSSLAVKFGTDGWRGVIGDSFTFENVRLVTQAAAKTFETDAGKKIFVGYDNRFLAEHFAKEVVRTLAQNGFKPQLTPHAVTSPLLSFITWKEKAPFGVMMTASHNPSEYLGFKMKGSFGGSVPQSIASEIEKNLSLLHPQKLSSGSEIKVASSPIPPYIQYLKTHIDFSLFNRKKVPVVFDFLYGPGGLIAEPLFKSVPHKLSLQFIHHKRDPLFGGLHPEPIEPYLEDLKIAVKKTKSSVGFALDGDGDRLGLVDENGKYLTPQQIFPLLLFYLADTKKLKGKVVQAVSLGYLSQRIAQDFNLPFDEVSVGFKYVAEKMLQEEVILGGEESGGYAFSKTKSSAKNGTIIPERDGTLSSLLFLEMICASGKKVSELLNDLQKRYGSSCYLRKDIHLDFPIADKKQFIAKVQNLFPSKWESLKIKEMRTFDGLKVIFEDDSWVLIRPSGTEPLLRTYAEFPKESLAEKSLAKLSKLLYNVLNP